LIIDRSTMNTKHRAYLPYLAVFTWVSSSTLLFMVSSRASYIHAYVFPSWLVFVNAIAQISLSTYLAQLLVSLFGVVVFSIACIGSGLQFLKTLHLPKVPSLAYIGTAFLVGEVALSLVFLAIISMATLSPATTALIITVCMAASFMPLRVLIQPQGILHHMGSFDKWQRFFLILVAAIMMFSLLLSASRLGYDAVSDYFSQAKIMALTHKAVSFFPENYMIVSSLHPNILFTALIQLFGDQSARMLSWVNGLIILLFGWLLAKETGLSRSARLYFLILMVTSTAFTDLLGDGKVELISSAPILGAIYWMVTGKQNSQRGIFLLIGLMMGFAIISRLYNIFLVTVFVICFYGLTAATMVIRKWRAYKKFEFSEIIPLFRPLIWMIPTLLITGIFHLWQNWIWLGSPVAPLKFAPKLGSSNWQWQFDPSLLPLLRWLYPMTATFFNTPQSLGGISPLFVGILPFLMLRDIRNRLQISSALRDLLLPALVTLLLWLTLFFTVVEVRYVFFIWVLFFLFAAQVIDTTSASLAKHYRNLLNFLAAMLLIFISLRTFTIALATYSPIDSNGWAHCQDIPLCASFESVNQIAAPGDRVFVLHAYRYYLRPDLFACSAQAHEYPLIKSLAAQNSGEFWAEVYRQGFRYITYENNFATFHSRFGEIPPPESAPEWLEVRVVSRIRRETTFQLNAKDSLSIPRTLCHQGEDNIWRVVNNMDASR